MATQTTYRLGDILISKGLITTEQLNIAMAEQQKRRQLLAPADQASAAPLGEILIELGFIDRMQLKRGLGWQSVVRKVTLAMSLCAPLLTISYEAAAAPIAPITSSSSSKSSSNPIPLTIQAENYSSMVGVQTEATTDVGGGLNVGYIDANDTMAYSSTSVTVPTTGTYKVIYRVAAAAAGGSFTLSEGSTTYDTVVVPNTGGYQTWVNVERTVTLTAGVHSFQIKALSGGFNINWFKIDNAGAALPQTLEAESYSTMTGVQTEATTDTGGGLNVGYIDVNDTLSYASNVINIPTTASYKVTYRVASGTGGGQFILNEVGSTTPYDTVTVPGTGGWQTWTTITRTVTLKAGQHKFGITSISGGFNINWFKIEAIASTASSTAAVSSVKATTGSSSSKASTVASSQPVTAPASSSKASSAASSTPVVASSSKPATVSSVASSSVAAASALPLTIKADSFSTMSGIQTETTIDTGGGMSVGYIDANDWLDFSKSPVTIPKTGTYKVTYRVASEGGGGQFTLNEAGKGAVYDTVTVAATGGWQTWTTVERTVTLTAGVHNFGITAVNGGFNLNWLKIEEIGTALPLTMEAEKFSTMSGIQTETTSDAGAGLSVGYIDANDWLAYSDTQVKITSAGTYTLTYRVASLSGGGSFTINEAGTNAVLDRVTVPSTGGWQNWIDVKRTVTLSAGTHTFKIVAITGGFNLNWFKLDTASGSSASSASSTVNTVLPKPSSSAASSVKASSSTASFSSSSAATSSTTSTNGVVTSQVAGPVSMSWIAPDKRQNGSVLDITEVAGYEIRYKLATDANFTYISVNDAFTNTYYFPWMEGSYVFQIAAFDKNGLYSDFVDVVKR